jgi:hypothetical protein
MEIKHFDQLNQVTPLSKYLATIIFVLMPFIGGYTGYTLAPGQVIEVERIVLIEKPIRETAVIESGLTIATTTIKNNVVEATFSDDTKKVIAQGLEAENVSDIYMIETYLKASLSPNGKFVALQAVGFEDYFVSVYGVNIGLVGEKIYGEVVGWTNDGRLEINACNLAGEECRQFISASAQEPGVMEEVRGN